MTPDTSNKAAAPSQSLNAEALRRGLKRLPQELFDVIHDLTFTVNPGLRDLGMIISGGKVTGTNVANFEGLPWHGHMKDLRRAEPGAPFVGSDTCSLLQVNKFTRTKVAASYYDGVFLARSSLTAMTWFSSLSAEHQRMVRVLYVSGEKHSRKVRRYGLEDAQRVIFGDWEQIVRSIKELEDLDTPTGSDYFEGKYGATRDLPLMRCTGYLQYQFGNSCYHWALTWPYPAHLKPMDIAITELELEFEGIGISNGKPVFGPPEPPEPGYPQMLGWA